jgi:hypothetical protein
MAVDVDEDSSCLETFQSRQPPVYDHIMKIIQLTTIPPPLTSFLFTRGEEERSR